MGTTRDADEDLLRTPTKDDLNRIHAVWKGIAGNRDNYVFAPKDIMEVWVAEHRMRAERIATARLTMATWVLMAATAVLAIATIALVIVTLSAG